VGPVFIRRGDVLFVIDSPNEFIEYLKSGKILPTDMMLVRDRGGIEWLPVSKIERYDFGSVVGEGETATSTGFNPKNLFDHIRSPRFNFFAFMAGGFWYLYHDMSRKGAKHLCLSLLMCSVCMIAGGLAGIAHVLLAALLMSGWFGYNITCGLRADYDLNRKQVERFHQQQDERQIDPVFYDQTLEPAFDQREYRIPTVRESILN